MSTVSRALAAVPDVDARWPAARDAARAYWYVWLGLAGLAVQLLTVWRVLSPVSDGTSPPLKDSIIFEYYGLRLAEGSRLYVDLWEVKPPLPFEVTAVLAWIAGGDPMRLHVLALAVTGAAAVGAAIAVGLVTFELTGDEVASLAAGLALYALPAFAWRAAFGFKPKYFVVALGFLALYLALRERPFAAGVAAAASVGFWQLAVVFPVLALGVVGPRLGRRAVGEYALGIALLAGVVMAPVVQWGAIEAMLAEAVLTPLLVSNDAGTIASQVGLAAALFGRTLPIALLGAIGVVLGTSRDLEGRWWLLAGAAWFALQVLALDLDAYPDLIPAFAFAAVGIGLVLGDRERPDPAVYGLVVAAVALSVGTLGPHGFAAGVELADPGTVSAPYRGAERPTLFWRSLAPESCRPFHGTTQRRLVELTGGSLTDETCGALEPLLEAFRSVYLAWL